jgi:hypothetical protein
MQIQNSSLSLFEAARLIGCHPDSLRRRVLRGEIQHFRFAGRIRISVASLEAYVVEEQGKPVRRPPLRRQMVAPTS